MSISFSGLATGLDTSSWVQALVALKQAKITTYETEQTALNTSKSALNQIKSFFASFRTMLEKVTDTRFGIGTMDVFSQNLATSSDATVLTASASADATEGVYKIVVDRLATNSQAVSTYKTTSSRVETITATNDTLLKTLGVNSGDIQVTVGGIGQTVTLEDDDTIGSLTNKLNNVGVNATYLELTGRFVMDIDSSDINVGTTNLISAFKLTAVNHGYQSASNITRTDSTEVFQNADTSTKLNELGLSSNSSMSIVVNGGSAQTVTVNSTDTIAQFISKLAAKGVQSDLVDGVFTIYNAEILNVDTNPVAQALGLTSAITNQTQESGNLSYNTTLYETTNADRDTKLVDLGISAGTININTTPFTINNTTTLGAYIDKFNQVNNGVCSLELNDGVLSVSGYNNANIHSAVTSLGAIGFTSDDAVVNSVAQTSSAQANSYTITVTTTAAATGTTTLNSLGYTGAAGSFRLGNVTINYGNKDTNLNQLITNIRNAGIDVSYADGELLIHSVGAMTGGSALFSALGLSESVVSQAMTSGKLQYTDNVTTVSSATLSTKLNDINEGITVTNGETIIFRNSANQYKTITLSTTSTLRDIKTAIENAGGSVTQRANGSLYITGAEITGGSYDVVSALRLSTSSTGGDITYSGSALTFNTVTTETKDADNDTLLSRLGITSGQYSIIQNGVRKTAYISEGDTIADLRATLQSYGIQAALTVDSTGAKLNLYSESDSYIDTSAVSGASNIISQIFSSGKTTLYDYTADLEVVSENNETVYLDREKLMVDYGYGTGEYYIYADGVRHSAFISSNTTLGDFMSTLEGYGLHTAIVGSGSGNYLAINGDGDSYITNASDSNVLKTYISTTKTYSAEKLYTWEKPSNVTVNPDNDSLMSDYGITSGQYYIYNNGVKYTANISTNETFGSFRDTLKSFGIQASFVQEADGVHVVLNGSGDSYIAKSNAATASNVVDVLFSNKSTEYNYSNLLQTSSYETATITATLTDKISDFAGGTANVAGTLNIDVDGVASSISLSADETFGSLINKFERLGITATLSEEGKLTLQAGEKTFSITKPASGGSNILTSLGLSYNANLGGYMASSSAITYDENITDVKNLSASNYAEYSTQLSKLNISSGTLSIYRDGQKATIQVNKDDTFTQLRTKINSAFSTGDVDIAFEDGFLKFYSTGGAVVEVGSSVDTSNIATICGLVGDGSGGVISSRELYRVNGDSVIMDAGLFRRGSVREGTLTIGNAQFTIDSTTTINSLIANINASDAANATAYWDSVDGKLVIRSRSSGSSYINVEAGTSNFTDILGLTTSEWNADGSVKSTKLNSEAQQIGDSALFSINGTSFTSTSNLVGSDITRINGVTLNLRNVSEGESVTLAIEKDTETISNAVSDIVDAYNELIDNVDKEIAKTGNLSDQSGLKMIRNQIRSLMTSSLGGALTFSNLASVGISVDAASASNISTTTINRLSFDKDKFANAFKTDSTALKKLLVGTEDSKGIFARVEDVVENSLMSVSGYFASAESAYNKKIQNLTDKINKQNTYVSNYQARLESKFQSMEAVISKIQQQYQSFLGS